MRVDVEEVCTIKKLLIDSGPSAQPEDLPDYVKHCDPSETGVAAVEVGEEGWCYHFRVEFEKPIYVKELEACALALRMLVDLVEELKCLTVVTTLRSQRII